MIRWAPWEVVASDLATGPLRPGGEEWRSRFGVRAPRGAAGIEVAFSLVGLSCTTVTASLPCAS